MAVLLDFKERNISGFSENKFMFKAVPYFNKQTTQPNCNRQIGNVAMFQIAIFLYKKEW